jgi:hypothetical protein
LIKDKAYTVWYNSTGDCFFIKASATGNTIASHVLAGDTFSTDVDNDLIGTMPINGTLNYNMPINGSFTIPLGYTTGGIITQNITTKSAQTYQPSTITQTIASGQYISEPQTIAPVTGNATVNDVVAGKGFNSANGINLVGQATIESLGGKRFTSGTSTPYRSPNTSTYAVISISLPFTPSIFFAYGSVVVNGGWETCEVLYNVGNNMKQWYIHQQGTGLYTKYNDLNNGIRLDPSLITVLLADGTVDTTQNSSAYVNWIAVE